MRITNFISFILLATLFSCNTATNKNSNPTNIDTSKVQATSKTVSESNGQSADTNEKELRPSDCVRGTPEPVVIKKVFPKTTFKLQSDSLTAFETVDFDNGDKLIIKNWGCEYYVLTFRFETTQFQQDTTNLEYWFKKAGRLMTTMLSGLDAPIDIKRGLVFLDSYILRDEKKNYKDLKLGEEIDFDGSEIRSFVTVDRIEKLTDKEFALTISFATGPL